MGIVILWLSGMYFHGARFSNYEAWLSDPTHIGPSAQDRPPSSPPDPGDPIIRDPRRTWITEIFHPSLQIGRSIPEIPRRRPSTQADPSSRTRIPEIALPPSPTTADPKNPARNLAVAVAHPGSGVARVAFWGKEVFTVEIEFTIPAQIRGEQV
uniref:Uncharacterized protein n=1 Tax=Ananas comosus var. bracteatus TaxID=296719 RepID=A0A6V7P9L3_ANACO|nr:unnamed protein product [Ananas comosus var. bracteatus]